jgi:hypothetical protein
MTRFILPTLKIKDLIRWLLIASVFCILALVIYLILRWYYPTVVLLPENEKEMGGYGPVQLEFSQPMQVDSVAQHFSIQPSVRGRQVWQGQTFWFWPEEPLTPGGSYQVILSAGSKSTSGHVIRQNYHWFVDVRQGQVLYLTPLSGGSEIWLTTVNGNNKKQLTQNGGKVIDFSVGRSGEWIAYSLKNQEGGADLWQVDRNGQRGEKILDCRTVWCSSPSWSPEGRQIVFSQTQKGNKIAGVAAYRVWLLDLASGKASPLYKDPKVTGRWPSWSPNGLRIASFDDQAGGTRVFDFQTKEDTFLHSSEGQIGSWSFDGNQMFFVDSNSADLNQHEHMYEVDFEIQATHPLPDPVNDADVIYSVPELNPGGFQLAIGLRYADGPASKQIWLMQKDGTQAHPLTENQVLTQAAYSWDPFGKALVYQRLELGSSQTRPEVVAWLRESDNFITIAIDAGQPRWLP